MDYKIIETIDGNGDSTFSIKKKFCWKFWKYVKTPHWQSNDFSCIKDAVKEIEFCTQDNLKMNKKKIIHNIKRTNIPEYIPKEQHKQWLTKRGTK